MAFVIAEAVARIFADTAALDKGVEKTKRTMGGLLTQMSGLVAAAGTLGLGMAAAFAAGGWANQERVERRLSAALAATGQEVEKNTSRLGKLASAIQSVTTYGDEAILEGQALATNMGVQADKMDMLTKVAVGLAHQFLGGDVQQGFRMASMAMQGQTELLGRYIPQVRGVKDAHQAMAIVMQAGMRGFVQAQDAARTTAGRLAQLRNSLGDIGESIGQVVAPSVQWFAEKLRVLADRITNMSLDTRTTLINFVKWTTALAATAYAIGKVIQVVNWLRKAKAELAKAMAVVQAFSGPKGWLILAGSMIAAGAAVWGVNKLLADTGDQSQALAQKTEAIGPVAEKAGGRYVTAMERVRDAISDAQVKQQQMLSDLDKGLREIGKSEFWKKLREFEATRPTTAQFHEFWSKSLAKWTGDQAADLSGRIGNFGMSPDEIARRDIARAGAPGGWIKQLERLEQILKVLERSAVIESKTRQDIVAEQKRDQATILAMAQRRMISWDVAERAIAQLTKSANDALAAVPEEKKAEKKAEKNALPTPQALRSISFETAFKEDIVRRSLGVKGMSFGNEQQQLELLRDLRRISQQTYDLQRDRLGRDGRLR